MEKVQQEEIRALSGLMGIAMKEVRGKASGKIINEKLKEKIQKILNQKDTGKLIKENKLRGLTFCFSATSTSTS